VLRYTDTSLEELDPITLALHKTTTLPLFGFGGRLPSKSGVLTGNDARAWLSEQLFLSTYNLDTGVAATVEHGNASNFDQSLFVMSRNGERLVDAPFDDSVPNRYVYYMNSADTLWRDSGVRTFVGTDLKLNDDGSRAVVDFTTVLNGEYQALGVMNLPPATPDFKAAALPSPNGQRAYVLTVNDTGAGHPTVYVYDTSSVALGNDPLPLIGSFHQRLSGALLECAGVHHRVDTGGDQPRWPHIVLRG
jgi:hypothetical protein